MRARWVCLAVVAFGLSGSLPAGAYVAHGRPWPGGVIRYYNAAPDQAWAVKRAADAWNASGARLRFVATSAAQADVRIEHFPGVDCTINAEATVGYAAQARIWIFKRDDGAPFCNPYMAARSLAHEFGHVLGLEHETRGCSLMNPKATLYDSLRYSDAIDQRLSVMDQTAFTMGMENRLPLVVFNVTVPGNLVLALRGETVGTRVTVEV
jgi:hypothetical protein